MLAGLIWLVYRTKLGVAMRAADSMAGKGLCLRTDIYNTRILALAADKERAAAAEANLHAPPPPPPPPP